MSTADVPEVISFWNTSQGKISEKALELKK